MLIIIQLSLVHHHLLSPYIHTFKGETLGCTSAKLNDCDCIVFVADGRFHLEAAMIQNPDIPAFRYDPYSKVLTSEGYDTVKMKEMRWYFYFVKALFKNILVDQTHE